MYPVTGVGVTVGCTKLRLPTGGTEEIGPIADSSVDGTVGSEVDGAM